MGEFIMDDVEIYLNRLSVKGDIYAEIALKTNPDVTDADSLDAYLKNDGLNLNFKLYVSSESESNETIDEIFAVFRKYDGNISCQVIKNEFLNLIDDDHHMLPQAKPRCLVHRDGDLHPAVHVWIVMKKDMGVYVLLQKRSDKKKIHPECYDVSAAGHVPQSEEFRIAAVRETEEELGLKISEHDLDFLGFHKSSYSCGEICDNEIRAVYLYRKPIDDDQLVLQESEVESVCWAEIDELLAGMDDASFVNCIDREELFMIKKSIY